MSTSTDPYTAKAVGRAAKTLGQWMLLAAVVHAVLLPIMSVITAGVTAKLVKDRATIAIEEAAEEFRRNAQQSATPVQPAPARGR